MSDSLPETPGRTLIFVVSYEASRHITSTLGRIPAALLARDDVDVLVIDDASKDHTATHAHDWARGHDFRRLTVLRNPVNQGYGGNQKLGYRLAIDHGYDFVILLHGDGQYAPELLPKFIETWHRTDADVVLGTRMDSIRSARAGGMPWYKVAGNRALTWMQNKLTGRALTEYHTGYRGYSTRFLRAVPFEINTNAFHFDTEILLQAFHIDAKIEQFAIPTHYGDEVCHVDGKRYAMDVLRATVQFRLHQFGIMCSLRYRNLLPLRFDARARSTPPYASHIAASRAITMLAPGRVLDLGQPIAAVLDACHAVGAKRTSAEVGQHSIGLTPLDAFDFDAVLLLEVLEKLAEPEAFLIGLRNDSRATDSIRQPPAVVLTTPNVAFVAMRLNLLLGRFSYAERGILHVRHKRLFTRRALKRTLAECGYTIERIDGVAVPFTAVLRGPIGRFLEAVSGFFARVWPSMFAFQFLVLARPLPGVHQLLAQSERYLEGWVAEPVAARVVDGVTTASSAISR